MKSLRIFLSIVLCAIMCVTFTACGDKHREAYLYFELSEQPFTLDPQTASEDSELLIIRNIFEGLMRYDVDGNLVCGAAESYKKDGLTYTFKLREFALWSTGIPLSADDFVFGLRRAVNPETAAPFVSRLFCISGAKAINSGQADPSSLGVTAVDARTVKITLESEDENLLSTLASSVAMPCNESFWNECIGKYGLESKYIIANGSYSIRKWAKGENFGIRLYDNEKYNGDFIAENAAVYLSCREEKNTVELLENSKVDMAFLNTTETGNVKSTDIKVIKVPNICWVMTIGHEYSADVRRAFAKLTAPDVYSDSLPEGFTAATTIYPEVIDCENTENVGVTAYDLEGAQGLFSTAVKKMENKRLPSSVMTYYNDVMIKDAATAIIGHWQQNLSAFVNIVPSDSANLESQLTNKSLQFAVFPIKAANSNVSEYLLKFGLSSSDAVGSQKKLLADNTLIPIAFENTNIAFGKSLTQFAYNNDNGYIDFSFIIKEK